MTVSLSGLDLSFLRKDNPDKIQRGRFRFDRHSGELVTMGEWHRRNPQIDRRSKLASPFFMPDIDAAYGGSWKSIIDGTQISSRTNWREHNKRNEVMCVDRDYWGWTENDHITEIEERMGYDPALVGDSDTFNWKNRD